jgi:hypothetical protein
MVRKALISKRKGKVDVRGVKSYKKEKKWSDDFMANPDPIIIKIDKDKVPFRVDARTLILIDKNATDEYKQSLKNKYAIDKYVDEIVELVRIGERGTRK